MSLLRRTFAFISLFTAVVLGATPARAIIVMGDQGQNISSVTPAPNGLDQYEGQWGASFLGTPIAPRYFVTATHVGAQATFTFNNGTSTPTTYHPTFVANSGDLSIYTIAATDPSFTLFAPLYTSNNEISNPLVTIGRGTTRGAAVTMPQSGGDLRGWLWGTGGGVQSWGTNVVDATPDASQIGAPPAFGGSFLQFGFDRILNPNGTLADPNEGIFSGQDSSGATFVRDPADGVWKLAGINSLVDGPWSYAASGPYFNAALFDARGFFNGDPTNNVQVDPNAPNPIPASSYATRISTRIGFIDSVIGAVPEPSSIILVSIGGIGSLAVAARQRRKPR